MFTTNVHCGKSIFFYHRVCSFLVQMSEWNLIKWMGYGTLHLSLCIQPTYPDTISYYHLIVRIKCNLTVNSLVIIWPTNVELCPMWFEWLLEYDSIINWKQIDSDVHDKENKRGKESIKFNFYLSAVNLQWNCKFQIFSIFL